MLFFISSFNHIIHHGTCLNPPTSTHISNTLELCYCAPHTLAKIAKWDCNLCLKGLFHFDIWASQASKIDSYLFLIWSNCHEKAMYTVLDECATEFLWSPWNIWSSTISSFFIFFLSDLKPFFIHCDQVTNYVLYAIDGSSNGIHQRINSTKTLNQTHDYIRKSHGLIWFWMYVYTILKMKKKKAIFDWDFFINNYSSHGDNVHSLEKNERFVVSHANEKDPKFIEKIDNHFNLHKTIE